MASYNLNEVLKQKKLDEAKQHGEDGQLALDDVTRVKVLSPGRKVFKSFIRNRLAVFGSVTLIFLFAFSFIGPTLYPYGQKEIFYKYEDTTINYALAKGNDIYNGYVVGQEPATDVKTKVNTTAKSMNADTKLALIIGEDKKVYALSKIDNKSVLLYDTSAVHICNTGLMKESIGTYDAIGGNIKYNGNAIDGLDAACKACKGNSGSFEFNGTKYYYEKGQGKSFSISAEVLGTTYFSGKKNADFETAMTEAIEKDCNFTFDGKEYAFVESFGVYSVYEINDMDLSMVYTIHTLDLMNYDSKVSDSFRPNAILAAYAEDNSFVDNGKTFTAKVVSDGILIYDENGNEFAEFNTFSVRRYSGEDSVEYDLKKEIAKKIEDMQAKKEASSTFSYVLPQQNEDGSYKYDEDGKLLYVDSEMQISQRDTGEYVIRANQIIYVINMYDSPSAAHLLGTDGDGFDVLSRIMYGGRVSLMVGFVVVFLEIFLGVIMGGLAGFYGGWVDNLIMRLVDIFYCLPSTPIMIILGAMMDAMRLDTYVRLLIMMAALGIMGWAGVARLVRGQILSLREQEFMVAAEATGIRVKDRIFKHLVPNVMPQLIVTATAGMGGVIITESTLSFLGLGVKHPLATWGTIINSVSSASAMAHYAHIWIPVGVLICFTVIAFNFVGDGLRDAYDPKGKR